MIASKGTLGEQFDPPHGDLGGNRVAVKRLATDPAAMNLHFYWDSLVFRGEPGFPGVEAMVAQLMKEPSLQRDQLKELASREFLDWAEESLALCKSTVYRGNGEFLKFRALPPRKVDLTGLDAPALPDGYEEIAERVAARRMVLAGYRLADQLRQAFKAGE